MRWHSRSLLVVVLLLVAGLSVVGTGSVAAQQVNVAATDLPGDGTQADPYVITNASELQAIDDNPDAHYELGNDIDASGTAEWNSGSGFKPIEYFTGHFDGNQYEISGLSIDREETDSVGLFTEIHDATVANVHITNSSVSGRYGVGILAGSNSEGGVVRNVSTSGTVVGADSVGGLIGYNIDSGVVTQSSSSANITVSPADRDFPRAGGLAGGNFDGATISRSYATGEVDGVNRTGGLLGENFNNSRVAYSYATGSVNGSEIGGLVGGNYRGSTVAQSYWDTNTSGLFTSAGDAAGLTTAQMTGQPAKTNMSGLDFNSVWQPQPDDYPILRSLTTDEDGDSGDDGDNASGSGFVDIDASDLAGDGTETDPYVITNASELQAMEDDLDAHYELGNDIDASDTAQWNNGSGFDPVGSVYDSPFSGSLDGNGHTVNRAIINPKSKSSREGSGSGIINSTAIISYANANATIYDISVKNITAIGGGFVGSLVGYNAGGTIKNVRVTGSFRITENVSVRMGSIAGLNEGLIRNVTATGDINSPVGFGGGLVGWNTGSIQHARATVNINSSYYAGGLAGINHGNIRNSIAIGAVNGSRWVGGLAGASRGTIQNATATGKVTGSNEVGGLVGRNRGSIQNATATGKVTGSSEVGGLVGVNGVADFGGKIQNATAKGAVNASEYVGGLVGVNRGSISDTFAVGSVTGSTNVGGLVGIHQSGGDNQNSYWDEQATGQATSAGANATGLTTAQMTGQAAETNITGLDFDSVWKTQPDSYPVLRSLSNSDDTDSGSGSPTNFTVTINLTNTSVIVGEGLNVEYTIENTGGMEATQEIEFLINDTSGPPSRNITLGSGETTSGEFGYTTDSRDMPAINITVSSATNSVIETVAVEGDNSSGGGGGSGQLVYEEEIFLSGSTITVNTSGASAIAVENLPTNATINKVSANGTYYSDNRSILYSNLTDEGLPANVTFRLDPDASAYDPNDTVTFSVDRTEVTLTVAAVPQELQGDLTGEQYTAVLDSDDTLSATNLADAINEWADTGEVNGVDIGAYELSELINYWADS